MFGYWYNSSLRNYIVLMGALFNHVQVKRVRGDQEKYIKVPITYASKEKFLASMNKLNYTLSQENVAKTETILPRMNLSLVDLQYNAIRKTSIAVNQKMTQLATPRKTITQFNPVPYRLIFELGVYTRYEDDMFQIAEQILPYFQPHFNCKITELHKNEITVDRDIKISLQSVAPDTTFEGDTNQRRHVEWSFMFELQGYLYPPVTDVKGEIRTVYTDFFSNMNPLDKDNFESVDSQADPVDLPIQDYTGEEYIQTYSHDKPIPSGDEPPKPRE
ncbi:tail sheath stabilizer and completion protein [Cronobacter phage vB_CsaM_GAP161]|uniref:Tail sheath stabilizer and completion protein n=1 Tax=Cronobacter phage vB_CsaM_GAP161 TaxID=1141138 RepID=K4F9Y3_9CAUD|nr:tail sheath stabilizer and completion protein [Cronobacter phage vB_CsaM_GAP161]AFC22310.1 tail sheath stabilizer and completion protein [Cronobacter phage vB_CsaM_GAP161]